MVNVFERKSLRSSNSVGLEKTRGIMFLDDEGIRWKQVPPPGESRFECAKSYIYIYMSSDTGATVCDKASKGKFRQKADIQMFFS